MIVRLGIVLLLASAASADAVTTRASLLLAARTAQPGDTVMAGVRLQMATNWHTYWRNPGESGKPTTINWKLPDGISAGEILWPTPEKFVQVSEVEGAPTLKITTYVLHDDALLLVPLTLDRSLGHGSMELKAEVTWLECDISESCVPGRTNLAVTLTIGDESVPSGDAARLNAAQSRLPKSGDALNPQASWEGGDGDAERLLVIGWSSSEPASDPEFFPDAPDNIEISPDTEVLSDEGTQMRLRKRVKLTEGNWPQQITGLLTHKIGDAVHAYEVKLTLAGSGGAAIPDALPPQAQQSFGLMLVYAFVGGLILNVMPCVFPVIALKILGFVQQSKEEPRRVFTLGLIYAAGVLVSFLVMAGLVIAIKAGGGSATWGMQFKSPQFSLGLIVLVVLIALNLFGVFEVGLGSGTMNAANQLAAKQGAAGAFFNGVLATVLATPCTAPVLAWALGFAFIRPPLVILIFFLTIGIGLAFPYVLLSWRPGWLGLLPRPGAWMERFKVAMGFPMLATGIWIYWFTAPRFGEGGILWVGWFLVAVAASAWVWGEFIQRGSKRRGLAVLICLGTLVSGYGIALEMKLHWRSPPTPAAKGELANDPGGLAWKRWSTAAVDAARAAGQPVLVDFTAKWCPTCNAIVKPTLNSPAVKQKLKEVNGVALLADYSNYPADMEAEIKKYHPDGGIPLVLVFPSDTSRPPEVFATPSKNEVLRALEEAAL